MNKLLQDPPAMCKQCANEVGCNHLARNADCTGSRHGSKVFLDFEPIYTEAYKGYCNRCTRVRYKAEDQVCVDCLLAKDGEPTNFKLRDDAAKQHKEGPSPSIKEYPDHGTLWTHSKSGNDYEVLMVANKEAESSAAIKFPVTIVYEDTNGRVWSRPFEEWKSRFHFKGTTSRSFAQKQTDTTSILIANLTEIKSDGASSGYYDVPKGAKDAQDIIQAKKMDHTRGEIFLAMYRTGEKKGVPDEYNYKKAAYYSLRKLARLCNNSKYSDMAEKV